jgi:hypothetical protein
MLSLKVIDFRNNKCLTLLEYCFQKQINSNKSSISIYSKCTDVMKSNWLSIWSKSRCLSYVDLAKCVVSFNFDHIAVAPEAVIQNSNLKTRVKGLDSRRY